MQPALAVLGALLLATGALAARVKGIHGLVDSIDPECAPQQVHIALSDEASKIHVSWKTDGANCPSEVSWWLVRGPNGGDEPPGGLQSATGYSFLLSERDMCSDPAASNPFAHYLHRAVITGLVPGGRYRYLLPGSDVARPFRAQPAPGGKFKFVAFGDMGDGEHAAAKSPGAPLTLSALQQEQPWLELAVHVGDISYAKGNPDMWDSFMAGIEPLASRVPYMVVTGNHEYGYEGGAASDPSGCKPYAPGWGNYGPDSGGECGVMLARHFMMPGLRGDNPPFWYGFEYGGVHFTAISTEHDLAPGSPQHAWLDAELAKVDRCRTPWLVLLLHRPMYVVYPHKSNREVGDHIRTSIEPLLRRHLVDAAISGHVHSYYRTCPAYDGDCTTGGSDGGPAAGTNIAAGPGMPGRSGGGGGGDGGHGTVHIIVGSAGHELSALEEGQEGWLVAARQAWGYSRFTVESDARMTVEFVASESGLVLDSFELAASDARLRGACPTAAAPHAQRAGAPAS